MKRGKRVNSKGPQEVAKALACVGSSVLLANPRMGCAMALTNTGEGLESKVHLFSTPNPITAKGALSRAARSEIAASGIMPSLNCGSSASARRLVARGAMAAAFSGAMFLGMGTTDALADGFGFNYFGGTNPLGELMIPVPKPAFVDIDHDGDMDCFVGEGMGSIQYWKNNGQANSPSFGLVEGNANPLTGTRVFMDMAAPTFVDIDEDGDMDCFIGHEYPLSQTLLLDKSSGLNSVESFVSFVENIGTPQAPVFDWSGVITDSRKTVVQNPLIVQDHAYCAVPTFADIDGDGDMDAFVGEEDGSIHAYQNITGEIHKGAITSTISFMSEGPLWDSYDNDIDAYDGHAAPAFMDADGDEDLDLFVGNKFGLVQYYENIGDAEDFEFVERTFDQNPLTVNPGHYSSPAFTDINGDGKMDAFFGTAWSYYDRKSEDMPHWLTSVVMRYYQNVGTVAEPDFRSRGDNPFNLGPQSFMPNPALGDVDGDGDLDALVGSGSNYYWFIWLLQGMGTKDDAKYMPKMYQSLGCYENIGTVDDPVFAVRQGENDPWGDREWYLPSAAIADLDGDGANEVYVGHTVDEDMEPYKGADVKQITPLSSTGVIDAYRFVSETKHFDSICMNPFEELELPFAPSPAFTDIDGDGDLDLFVSGNEASMGERKGPGYYSYDSQILFYRNTGSPVTPTFTLVEGDANPLTGVEGMILPHLNFADVDQDGDFDAVMTDLAPLLGNPARKEGEAEEADWGVRYFLNTGTKTAPVFEEKIDGANPFDVVADKALPSGAALADIDNDQDVDAVVGDIFGKLYYYRNIKTVDEANAILDDDDWLCFADSAQDSLWNRLADSCKQGTQKIREFFSPS